MPGFLIRSSSEGGPKDSRQQMKLRFARSDPDQLELELSEDAINPLGGIGSDSGELFGNPPPLESFRAGKSRAMARDFFPRAFLVSGGFFL